MDLQFIYLLLNDLYMPQSLSDGIKEYIDNQISQLESPLERSKLELLKLQLSNYDLPDSQLYTIDHDKSIMLALVLGNIFTEALEILGGKHVRFYTINDDIQQYLKTGSGTFITLVDQPSMKPEDEIKNHSRLMYTQLTQVLGSVGLHIEKDTLKPIEKQEPLIFTLMETFHTDLFHWYCSCEGYQKCYTKNWISGSAKPTNEVTVKPDFELFKHIKFDSINPIPICCHLLSILIISINQFPLYKVYKVNNFESVFN